MTQPRTPPTRHLVVDHDVLQKELDALHDDIFDCPEIPQVVREEITDILQETGRILTLDHISFVEREKELAERNQGGGAKSPAVGNRTPGRASNQTGSNTTTPRPYQQPWGNVNNVKLARSWNKLVKRCEGRMSVEEVALLSLPTIRELMHYYVLDRDPVELANVELYWRALAQQREDERTKKALPHKKCAAAVSPKGPARELAKQASPTKKHQMAGSSSVTGSVAASKMSGSFRR